MKYLVMIKENGQWVEQGDGPLTAIQAARIEREIKRECRVQTKIVPCDGIDREQLGAQAMELDNGII